MGISLSLSRVGSGRKRRGPLPRSRGVAAPPCGRAGGRLPGRRRRWPGARRATAQGARVGGRPYERAGAVADLEQAERLQELDRLPHRAAADLQLLAQLPLAGELIARSQNAFVDEPGELAYHPLLEGERPDRLEVQAGPRRPRDPPPWPA